jgi:hypothetical protein
MYFKIRPNEDHKPHKIIDRDAQFELIVLRIH